MTASNIQPTQRTMPASLLVGVGVVILFLSLFALEISHGLIREHGKIAKSLAFFPPTLVLFWGMLTRRRWALIAARLAAFLGACWFLFIAGLAIVQRPHDEHGAVWIWILCVSLVLAGVLGVAFVGLGRPTVRRHYGLICQTCQSGVSGVRQYFAASVVCPACDKLQ